jgi:hypothetical protein
MIMNRRIARALAVLALLAPALASAQARVLQFRSAEDPASPPDKAACAGAPFTPNLFIGGSLYTYETRERSGEVVTEEARAIGKATACAEITNFAFPPLLSQQFFLQLTLPDGVYKASGSCTIISNKVPKGGLVLAGCNLAIVAAPDGVIGGAVTSLSTFNPFRLVGFATGSYWTVQIYDADRGPERHQDSDHAMEWIDGGDHDPGK